MAYSGRIGKVYDEGFDEGRKLGLREGKDTAKKQMLSWLEREYMSPEVKRGTAPAVAMLELARRLSTEFTVE